MRHINLWQTSWLVIAISLVYSPKSFCQVDGDDRYERCGEQIQCGDRQFGYPFWGEGRPEYCGYPGFELVCESGVPLITIRQVKYRVLDIEYPTQNLTVAREDLWDDLCPEILYNTTLDFRIFNYSGNYENISLYYGCQEIPGQEFLVGNRLGCSINGFNGFGFYVTRQYLNYVSAVSCSNYAIVPVNMSALQRIADLVSGPDNLRAALAGGFWLQWFANDTLCNECTDSGGRCGHESRTNTFVCYCSNGRFGLTCNTEKNNKKALAIGLGIAGAVAAGIALCVSIILCRKRRRRVVAAARAAHPAKAVTKEIVSDSSSKALMSSGSSAFTNSSIPSYPSPTPKTTDIGHGSSYFGVQIFSFSELEEATDNFSESRELGDGGFGAVYYGVLSDGRAVAVKRLYEHNFKRLEQFMNEIEILAKMKHQNLVHLYGCTSRRSRDLLLVYEYIPNGTVADHLHGKLADSGRLSWPVRLKIAVETADALAYLHRSEIIHRDVKTNNILLDNEFHVKVADFGLSRLFPLDVTHVSTAPQGTPGYVDPEYYQVYRLTEKSDVFSFGVVLIELISSLQPVDIDRQRQDINLCNMAVNKIQKGALHELVDPSLGFETNTSVRRMISLVAELAFRCLQQERDMRPSMQEVLETLRGIEYEELNIQKQHVVEIMVDDVALLKGNSDPPSPDKLANNTPVPNSM